MKKRAVPFVALLLAIALSTGAAEVAAEPIGAPASSPSTAADPPASDPAPAVPAGPTGPGPSDPTQGTPAPHFSGEIKVLGQSPLVGAGQASERAPGVVETATADEIKAAQPLDLSDFMTSHFTTVTASDTQGSPFERDLEIRGFTASPVLGTPQGIAFYQDGVRLNEPFGDTIDWDLIPMAAVSRLELMPGSSPVFGLNAQGGAIVLDTKTALSDPGVEGSVRGGSFGSRALDASAGQRWGALSALAAGDTYDEDSWREHSPARVRQGFADLGWSGGRGSIDLSVTGTESRLAGNGATPVQLLAIDPAAVFTFPDSTARDALLSSTRFRFSADPTTLLEGNVYVRRILTSTVNGDATPYEACQTAANAGLLCSDDGAGEQRVLDQQRNPVGVGTPPLDGARNDTRLSQTGYGGSFQAAFDRNLGGRRNELLAGLTADLADALFAAESELGRLTSDRDTLGVGLFSQDSLVRVDSQLNRLGLFLDDTFLPLDAWTVHLAGRFDQASIHLDDQLGGELSGQHSYRRFNPFLGLTYAPTVRIVLHASYAESSRAPNPVELTCSDPTEGCRLPSAFVSDPPLAQVVTRTGEVGARGELGKPGRSATSGGFAGHLAWSVALYRADSANDILFINSGKLIGQGYFANVGRTRRQGLDLDLRGAAGEHFNWFLDGSLTAARFETPFLSASPDDPFAVNGTIAVPRGARLPLIPRYDVKAGFDVGSQRWRAGLEFIYLSPEFLRGDEANLSQPLPGQELVTATGRFALTKRLNLVAKITNLLDRQFASFGTFGDATEVLGPTFENPRFLVPIAPRAYTLGVELSR